MMQKCSAWFVVPFAAAFAGVIAACGPEVRSVPAAPEDFVGRAPLAGCGTARAEGPDSKLVDLFPLRAVDCMIAGRKSDGAEYVVEYLTTEGDPITNYLRVLPGIYDVEVFVDSSNDAYGGGWQHRTCRAGDLSPNVLASCLGVR
jgi:hypothetical protein